MKSPITLLIVEDEAIIAMDLQLQLKNAGYKISGIAATGEKALESIKQDKPDIILMDHGLAGRVSGIEAARQINTLYGIPIIFITGYQDQAFLDEIAQVRPFACLVKPLSIEKLITAINSAFN